MSMNRVVHFGGNKEDEMETVEKSIYHAAVVKF